MMFNKSCSIECFLRLIVYGHKDKLKEIDRDAVYAMAIGLFRCS
jgi:hypothetical protein